MGEVGLQRTTLFAEHQRLGARFIPFSGWEMPVQYVGLTQEHMAVRTGAGIFDVSHMGEIRVTGSGALAFLQFLTPSDIAALADGQIQYTALTTENGAPVDDMLVYRIGPEDFFLVVNAANTDKVHDWLREHRDGAVEIRDESDEWSLIAIQGRRAEAITAAVLRRDLAAIGAFRFEVDSWGANPLIVSRTGYTGEDGFELYCRPDDAADLWNRLLNAGKSYDMLPCGLGARDTLRLEAKLYLYGNDLDEEHTIIESSLRWLVNLDKGDFLGRQVLEQQLNQRPQLRLVGFEVLGPQIARNGYPAWLNGTKVGVVTSGTKTPFLNKNIGLAYLPRETSKIGNQFAIEIRNRKVPAQVVRTPFFRRDY